MPFLPDYYDITPGCVVRLLSGGPLMTVVALDVVDSNIAHGVLCAYATSEVLQRIVLSADALEVAEPAPVRRPSDPPSNGLPESPPGEPKGQARFDREPSV